MRDGPPAGREFPPTPPARRATYTVQMGGKAMTISPHAPGEEPDPFGAVPDQLVHISTHAPREEGDVTWPWLSTVTL